MVAKRKNSSDGGDQGHGEEDRQAGQSETKLPRLLIGDGEVAETDQEPRKEDQEHQAAVAEKRSKSDSGKEPDEADTNHEVSEAKKRRVADDSEGAENNGTAQDSPITSTLAEVTGIMTGADTSGQAPRDEGGRAKEENGGEKSGDKADEEDKVEKGKGTEEIGVIVGDQLQDAIAAVLIVLGLVEGQEGREGEVGEGGGGGGYYAEVLVQTDGGGYSREEVVENDEREQTTKETGQESEGNGNVGTVDEGEGEQGKEQEKQESERGVKGSDEVESREEEERDVTEHKKEERKGAEEGEEEGHEDSGVSGDDEGEDEERSGEEDEQDSDKVKSDADEEDPIPLAVKYSKETHVISIPLSAKMSALKKKITECTGVQPEMQKLCYRGVPKPLVDTATLRDSGLSANAKILLVGCTVNDLYTIMTPAPGALEKPPAVKKEPLCKQKKHKNIVADGVPEDAIPGILNVNDPLPTQPLKGMLNGLKQKVRLTFKLEKDEVWISTKEDTEKISIDVIQAVVSEPIEKHEEYHIMGLRVGPSEKLSVWTYIYWVPAQYVKAIKDHILG